MLVHQQSSIWQLFKQLKGLWQIERNLGNQGVMQGTALFHPHGARILHYQEQGTATWTNKAKFSARREYAYVYEQGALSVHFWDQQRNQVANLLHRLQFRFSATNLNMLVATGIHHCAMDAYQGHYEFLNQERFQLTYHVHGPRKDYTIQTCFRKLTATV